MNVKTVIIIESGIVSSVYSTLPAESHDIEVLDLDEFSYVSSPDEKDALQTRAKRIYESEEYHEVY